MYSNNNQDDEMNMSSKDTQLVGGVGAKRFLKVARSYTDWQLEIMEERHKTKQLINKMQKRIDFWERGFSIFWDYTIPITILTAILGWLGSSYIIKWSNTVINYVGIKAFCSVALIFMVTNSMSMHDIARMHLKFKERYAKMFGHDAVEEYSTMQLDEAITSLFEPSLSDNNLISFQSIKKDLKEIKLLDISDIELSKALISLGFEKKRKTTGVFWLLTKVESSK